MKMLGKQCPPFCGRDCCGDAPGKARKVARRVMKRRERQAWKRDVR